MDEKIQCRFFILRYAPDAVKNEFINVGLVLLPPAGGAQVRFTRDWSRVLCLDPEADVEMLQGLEKDLRDQLREMNGDQEVILRRIQDSFSNAIQPSEFEAAGVWLLMLKNIAVSKYTRGGDPLKIDCGYSPNGTVKLFHAVTLNSDVNAAKVLAFTFPQLAQGIRKAENKQAILTAIVEDDLPSDDESVTFARETLEQQAIRIAPVSAMAEIAKEAARDLGIR